MSSTPGWARRVTGPTSLTPTSPSWEWPALPTATPPCARRSSLDRDRHRHRLTVSGVSGFRFPRQRSRARVDARTRSCARRRHERGARMSDDKRQPRTRRKADATSRPAKAPQTTASEAPAPPPEPTPAPGPAAPPASEAPTAAYAAPSGTVPDRTVPDRTAAYPTAAYPTAAYPAAPVAPRPQISFAGLTAGDYLRDVVAALLLLISLGLRWDYANVAVDRIDVVLITIVSVFSLAVPYMARMGALGQGWTAGGVRWVRLLANAPYFVLVAVYLVIDILDGGYRGTGGGIGVALGVGLAGAILAAQPREGELGPDGARRRGGLWYWVVAGLGAIIVAGAITSLAITVVDLRDTIQVPDLIGGLLLLAGVLVLVV